MKREQSYVLSATAIASGMRIYRPMRRPPQDENHPRACLISRRIPIRYLTKRRGRHHRKRCRNHRHWRGGREGHPVPIAGRLIGRDPHTIERLWQT